MPPCLQACGSAGPADQPRLSLFWSRPGPGARSSHGRRSSEETRPGRAVSFCCSVHLAHPLACPRPSHKARPPSPWWERRLLRGRCAGEAGGNVCSQSTTSFHFTELTRTAVCFPHRSIASPTSASVRLGHGPLCRDEGPSPRSAPRAPLPRLSPGAAPRRDFPALRGQPHQQTRCVPPTPRHGPPLASQPPPGTTPICCSSQQNSSERMLRVSSDYLTAQFRPSFHPPLRPPATATSSTPGTLSIPPLA